jgi:hypothetical protein
MAKVIKSIQKVLEKIQKQRRKVGLDRRSYFLSEADVKALKKALKDAEKESGSQP